MPIEDNSNKLKSILGKYESDAFMSEMAVLLMLANDGQIPYQPFHRLHSPLRQIFYMAALNLSSNIQQKEEYDIMKNDEQYNRWNSIIDILYELDNEYAQVFINQEKLDEKLEVKKAQVAYPSFIDYYYTGPLHFEEQVIERIERYFINQNAQIETEFGLSVFDFINIYNILDDEMHRLLNRVLELLEIEDCRLYWEKMGEERTRPRDWELTDNDFVNELVRLMKDQSEVLKIMPQNLYSRYDSDKVDLFFQILSCNNKIDNGFFLLTQKNALFSYPIYKLNDGRFLVLQIKQVIRAVYDLLFSFSTRNENAAQKFYKKRGEELEIKIEEIARKFFGKEALIFRAYKTKLEKGQDILLYHKGMVLIIEAKSSKKDMPAVNVNAAFNQVKSNFKEIFQKGFEQTDRVESLFYNNDEVEIFDKKGKLFYKIRTKNVHHVFSIIITLEKFSQVQTDLSLLLEVENDIPYPYSISIDDLEILLMTMKLEKCSHRDFIHFMEQRVQFYGRLDCSDELELCGHFFYRKKLIVPPGEELIVIKASNGDEIFENYYEKGFGFTKEKNIDRKKSGKFMRWPNSKQIVQMHRSEVMSSGSPPRKN